MANSVAVSFQTNQWLQQQQPQKPHKPTREEIAAAKTQEAADRRRDAAEQKLTDQSANLARSHPDGLPNASDSGAMVVVDSSDKGPWISHQDFSAESARQQGLKGSLFTPSADWDDETSRKDQDRLGGKDESPQEFLANLKAVHVDTDVGLLNGNAAVEEKLNSNGMHDGGVNFSQGTSKARLVSNDLDTFDNARMNSTNSSLKPEEQQKYANTAANFEKAFGITEKDMQDRKAMGRREPS